MLTAATSAGLTAENAEAMQKLTDLYMRVEANNAAAAFAEAMCALQQALPRVVATRCINSKDGTVRSRFADYSDIMDKVGPLLVSHGFSVSYDMVCDDKRVTAICKLAHVGGHVRENRSSIRVGSGPPGCSEAQSDGSARAYARRLALCDALNIVIDKDTDARIEGACITEELAISLEERLQATAGNRDAFLRVAGVSRFTEIPETKYAVLDALLKEKERKR
jgi:hypothetical protein